MNLDKYHTHTHTHTPHTHTHTHTSMYTHTDRIYQFFFFFFYAAERKNNRNFNPEVLFMILCKKTFCLYNIWKLSLALLFKSQKIFYNNSAAIFFEILKCKIILQISYLFLCRLSFLIACVYTSSLRCKGAKSLGSCLLHKIGSWSL